jgi:hypothetical protein
MTSPSPSPASSSVSHATQDMLASTMRATVTVAPRASATRATSARAPARGTVSTRPKIQLTAREAFSRPQRARTTANAFFNGSGDDSNADGATQRVSTDSVMIDPVVGAKRFSNYFWAGVVTTGSTGFLITGLSAYFHHNLLFFLDASDIKFFPQGLVMSFYGVAGAMLATYLWLTISWDVGAGYNEFNKDEGIMRIFRYGFPGKNRRVNLVSDLADVQAVRVEISEGANPRRVVYVRCKGKRDIPLTRIGQPLTLAEVEQRAADLAKFLQVPIEGL